MAYIATVILLVATSITSPVISARIRLEDIGLGYSYRGWIDGKTCVKIEELQGETDVWNNNFICFDRDYGVQYSSFGTIDGMNCTNLFDPAEIPEWEDNFLCVPDGNPWNFVFSAQDDIPGLDCIYLEEPGDIHNAHLNNFLCIQGEPGISPSVINTITASQLLMEWSPNGPINGKSCVQVHEENDPHGWENNYICFKTEYGVRYSSHGPISGMECSNMTEPDDTHGWADNFLCVPSGNPWKFLWSNNYGVVGHSCVAVKEPLEHRSWGSPSDGQYSNFLCVQGTLYPIKSSKQPNSSKKDNSAEQTARKSSGLLIIIPILILLFI